MISKVKDSTDPQRFGPDAHVNVMMFPESWVALAAELQYHPKLVEQLAVDALFAECNFATNVGCIAAYVDVALDDEYTMEDIDKIFKICVDRLRKKRGLIDGMGKDLIILS